MKVKLKLKRRHAPILHEFLSKTSFPDNPDKEERSRKSIFEQIYMKVAKKSLEAQLDPEGKDISLSLHYHEAYELEQRLAIHCCFGMGTYQDNVIRIIRDELNQKLA